MTWIAIALVAVILFILGIVAPHAASKVQRRTDKKASQLKRMSDWLWDPLTWWSKKIIELSRKAIDAAAQWGKNLRGKLPF